MKKPAFKALLTIWNLILPMLGSMSTLLFTRFSVRIFLWNGLIQKKSKQGGLRIWNFQGYQRNSMCNFQGLIKNEVEFPGIFVFGLGISKGSNTIFRICGCNGICGCSTISISKKNLLKPLRNVILDPLGQKTTSITNHGPFPNQSHSLTEITKGYPKFVFYNSDYLTWGGVYVTHSWYQNNQQSRTKKALLRTTQ